MEKLNKSSLNRKWTGTLKDVFAEIAKEVDPKYVLSSSGHGGELLFDMAWRRSDSSPDIILCMESEWGDVGDVVNDFTKLMNVKASIKVMIFTTKGDDVGRLKMNTAIENCLRSSVHHVSGEEYALFNFPFGLPGMAYCYSYAVLRDGEQTEVTFTEKRKTRLWE